GVPELLTMPFMRTRTRVAAAGPVNWHLKLLFMSVRLFTKTRMRMLYFVLAENEKEKALSFVIVVDDVIDWSAVLLIVVQGEAAGALTQEGFAAAPPVCNNWPAVPVASTLHSDAPRNKIWP